MSPPDFRSEVNTIKNIASENGYNTILIDRLLLKEQRSKFLSLICPYSPEPPIKYVSTTFVGSLSHCVSKLISYDFRTSPPLKAYIPPFLI